MIDVSKCTFEEKYSDDLFTDKNNKICLEINIEMECDE